MMIQPLTESELENRLVPSGWCYLCCGAHLPGGLTEGMHQQPQPETLASWATGVACAVSAEAGLMGSLYRWSPADVEMARAIAAVFTDWADVAEYLATSH